MRDLLLGLRYTLLESIEGQRAFGLSSDVA